MQNIRGMLEIIMLFILICKINWGCSNYFVVFYFKN